MSAARADGVGKCDQLAAVRTTLSGGSVDLHTARAPFFTTNIDAGAAIDGAVPPDVACKIQNEAVTLIVSKPRPATNHLHRTSRCSMSAAASPAGRPGEHRSRSSAR